jgi:hypothetical protein
VNIDFKLPPKSIFPEKMPRYPNVWFYIPTSLVKDYREAVYVLARCLEKYVHLVDDFSYHHRLFNLLFDTTEGEGCDLETRYRGIQPYTDLVNPALSHDHQLHARYYFSDLVRNGAEKVTLTLDEENWDCYRVALSVHYEPTTENKNHPYTDSCPFCGNVGEYDIEMDPDDRCRLVHDPLGVELLLNGTIRGQKIYDYRGEEIGLIEDMKKDCDIEISIENPKQEDMDTAKIGYVIIKHLYCDIKDFLKE